MILIEEGAQPEKNAEMRRLLRMPRLVFFAVHAALRCAVHPAGSLGRAASHVYVLRVGVLGEDNLSLVAWLLP